MKDWPFNPFVAGPPVIRDHEFFGRVKERQKLEDAVQDTRQTTVLVSGPRRIGKTSMIKRLNLAVQGKCKSTIPPDTAVGAFVDCRELEDRRAGAIFRELLADLCLGLGIDAPSSFMESQGELFKDWANRIRPRVANRRLVFSLDEVEVLHPDNAHEFWSALEIIRSLDAVQSPLLVVSWGRNLGLQPQNQQHAHQLKSAFTIELGRFEDETVSEILGCVDDFYLFEPTAVSLLRKLTGNHPLFIMACNHVIYNRRRIIQETSSVHEDEIAGSVEETCDELEQGLIHTWQGLTPIQSHFSRALADLSQRKLHGKLFHTGSATMQEVYDKILLHGVAADCQVVRTAIPALEANLIIEIDPDSAAEPPAYRFLTPILGTWLSRKDYQALIFTSTDHEADRINSAYEAAIAAPTEPGLVEEAASRIKNAIGMYGRKTHWLGMVVQLEIRRGNIDSALVYCRDAAANKPEEFRTPLIDLLVQRIRRAVKDNENPRRWHDELRGLDAERASKGEMAELLRQYHISKWHAEFKNGSLDKAAVEMAALVEEDLVGWRAAAIPVYTEAMQYAANSTVTIPHALAAIKHAFLHLTSRGEIAAPSDPNLAADVKYAKSEWSNMQREKREQERNFFGVGLDFLNKQIEAKERHIKELEKRQRLQSEAFHSTCPPEWEITIKVLDRAWELGVAPENFLLSAEDLRNLMIRAPKSAKQRLSECYGRHLVPALEKWLCEFPRDAMEMVKLICDQVTPIPFMQVWNAIGYAILGVSESHNDELAAELFGALPRIMLFLFEEGRKRKLETPFGEIVPQIEMLWERVDNPREKSVPMPLSFRDRNAIPLWVSVLNHLSTNNGELATADIKRKLDLLVIEQRRIPQPSDHRVGSRLAQILRELNIAPNSPNRSEFLFKDLKFCSLAGLVQTCSGRFRNSNVDVKAYDLKGTRNESTRALLRELWEKERRVLLDIGTRRRGRGLASLVESYYREEDGVLLVLTDSPQTLTMRELLLRGRIGLLDPANRSILYRELRNVVEAVDSLHRAGYLHRSIRPENILVVETENGTQLRLGNFEWSVYLHDLGAQKHQRFSFTESYADRYIAPEMRRRGDSDNDIVGDGFSADVFALGLLVYEVLGVRFNDTDLMPGSEQDDRNWLESDIANGILKDVDPFIQPSLRPMLRYDARIRGSDLSELSDALEAASIHDKRLQQLVDESPVLHITTTLFDGTAQSIRSHLSRSMGMSIEAFNAMMVESLEDVPQNSPVAESDFARSKTRLLQFLQQQLSGARVYRNKGNPSRPLILVTKTLRFTLHPFESDDRQILPGLPFLEVAGRNDRIAGPPLVTLSNRIKVEEVGRFRKDTASLMKLAASPGGAWRQLFYATHGHDELPRPQLEFLYILHRMAIAERILWGELVYEYERKAFGPDEKDGNERVVIGPVEIGESEQTISGRRKLSLAGFVAQQVSRESHTFELGNQSDPLAPFDPTQLWVFEKATHTESGIDEVILMRPKTKRGAPPPTRGFLRPETLDGNRPLHFRRQNLLRRLEDDLFLLQAVTQPEQVTRDDTSTTQDFWFQSDLDENKQRIIRKFKMRRPLLVVQGPPGTGKTQLATEVVMQTLFPAGATLRTNASSLEKTPVRILVTAQAHDPLNNLLLRVEGTIEATFEKSRDAADQKCQKGITDSWSLNRPISLRLIPQHRINMLRLKGKSEAIEINEKYSPASVAKRMLDVASEWNQPSESPMPSSVVEEWKRLIHQDRNGLESDLQRRLVSCANIVYATANDAAITTLENSETFDLLIFEEAAKAYPLELLGPMRLARRWLLIGDHNQLPPFAVEEFAVVLNNELLAKSGAVTNYADRNALFQDVQNELPQSKDIMDRAGQYVRFFQYLHAIPALGGRQNDDSAQPDAASLLGDRLTVQWRMAPAIGKMLSQAGYYRFLTNAESPTHWQKRMHCIAELLGRGEGFGDKIKSNSLVWIDTPLSTKWRNESSDGDSLHRKAEGRAAELPALGGGYINNYEAWAIVRFLQSIRINTAARNCWPKSLMILSPYQKQVRRLDELLRRVQKDPGLKHLRHLDLPNCVSTVDSAQGRQADLVLVSLVRNNPNQISNSEVVREANPAVQAAFGFLASNERAGVMFSRAESMLVIVGCGAHFGKLSGSSIANVYDFISLPENGLRLQADDLLKDDPQFRESGGNV